MCVHWCVFVIVCMYLLINTVGIGRYLSPRKTDEGETIWNVQFGMHRGRWELRLGCIQPRFCLFDLTCCTWHNFLPQLFPLQTGDDFLPWRAVLRIKSASQTRVTPQKCPWLWPHVCGMCVKTLPENKPTLSEASELYKSSPGPQAWDSDLRLWG